MRSPLEGLLAPRFAAQGPGDAREIPIHVGQDRVVRVPGGHRRVGEEELLDPPAAGVVVGLEIHPPRSPGWWAPPSRGPRTRARRGSCPEPPAWGSPGWGPGSGRGPGPAPRRRRGDRSAAAAWAAESASRSSGPAAPLEGDQLPYAGILGTDRGRRGRGSRGRRLDLQNRLRGGRRRRGRRRWRRSRPGRLGRPGRPPLTRRTGRRQDHGHERDGPSLESHAPPPKFRVFRIPCRTTASSCPAKSGHTPDPRRPDA
jgi:hypothetical protein